jgi:hypothetical protein
MKEVAIGWGFKNSTLAPRDGHWRWGRTGKLTEQRKTQIYGGASSQNDSLAPKDEC